MVVAKNSRPTITQRMRIWPLSYCMFPQAWLVFSRRPCEPVTQGRIRAFSRQAHLAVRGQVPARIRIVPELIWRETWKGRECGRGEIAAPLFVSPRPAHDRGIRRRSSAKNRRGLRVQFEPQGGRLPVTRENS